MILLSDRRACTLSVSRLNEIEICTNPEPGMRIPRPRAADVVGFYIARLISRGANLRSHPLPRACGVRIHAFFHFPPWPDRIVPFAPPSGTATLSTFATRSPISPSQSMRYSTLLSPPRSRVHHLSSPLASRVRKPLSRISYIRWMSSLHPLCTGIASTANLCAMCSVLRIQRTRVICFPTNFLRGDRKYGGGYTRHAKSRVFLAGWLSNP